MRDWGTDALASTIGLSPKKCVSPAFSLALKAVEEQTCLASEFHRDRNRSRSQVRAFRTQNENRSADLQTCLKQALSYGLQNLAH